MKVKALKKTYYNRRDVLPGETYEMDDREEPQARALAAIGTIEIIKDEPEKPAQAKAPVVETRALAAEEPPAQEQQSTAVGPMTTQGSGLVGEIGGGKRIYRRRDLKAEK